MAEAKKSVKKEEKPKAVKATKVVNPKAETKAKVETKPKVKTATQKSEKPSAKKPVAKAGKRSAKAVAETKAEEAKKARAKVTEEPKPKHKPTRTKLERAGKKYRETASKIDQSKTYKLDEAIKLAAQTSPVKFDASVELHFNLGIDVKQADQNIRGTVQLPSGTGKTIKVAVFAEGTEAEAAKKAGADKVGSDDLLAELDKGTMDFEILITSPALMARLAKYAKLLGPKGLMPNPKSGSVTNDISKAVTEAKAGKVEYRADQAGIVHLGIGKISQGDDALVKNGEAVMAAIKAAKPASVKGIYLKSAYASSTMGPSVKIEV